MFHQLRRNRLLSLMVLATFPFVCFLAGYMVVLLSLGVVVLIASAGSLHQPSLLSGLSYDLVRFGPVALVPIVYSVLMVRYFFSIIRDGVRDAVANVRRDWLSWRTFVSSGTHKRRGSTRQGRPPAHKSRSRKSWIDVEIFGGVVFLIAGSLVGLAASAVLGLLLGQILVDAIFTVGLVGAGYFATPSLYGGYILALFGLAFAIVTWFRGSNIVVALAGARPATSSDGPLVDVVASLALGAGITAPAAYVLRGGSLEIYSVSGGELHSTIVVGSGLLGLLKRDQLEGVLAHEVAHIRNGDSRLLATLTALFGGAALTSRRLRAWLGEEHDDPISPFFVVWAALMTGLVGWAFGGPVRTAFTRTRELLADAEAIELTREPSALISALKQIESTERKAASNGKTRGLSALLASHSLAAERLHALEMIAAVQET